jgi:hypothetical protein
LVEFTPTTFAPWRFRRQYPKTGRVAAPGLECLAMPMGQSFPQSSWQKIGRLKIIFTGNNGCDRVAR